MSTPRNPSGKPAHDAAAQAAIKLVGRTTITFGICMVAVLVCAILPLPWSLAGIGFGIGTFLAGRQALHAIKAAPPATGSLQLLVLLGIAMTAVTVLNLVGQAVIYPEYSQYQTCQQQALTETAVTACTDQFTSSLTQRFPVLAGFVGAGS